MAARGCLLLRMVSATEDRDSGKAPAKQSRELVDAIRRSKLFRQYERVFADATGLPLAIRPIEYFQIAHHDKTHENRFCSMLAQNPATLVVCLKAHEDLVRRTGDKPHTVTCPFGLTETAIPVRLGRA